MRKLEEAFNAGQLKEDQVMAKKFFVMIAALVTLGGLSACNTIEGAGEDVESVGEEVEETANDAS